MATRATSKPARVPAPPRGLLYLAGWLVPGLAHLWLGRRQKGLVFLVALPAMFLLGLFLHGRIFPFVFSEPLVGLAAVADLWAGAPYFFARLLGQGVGQASAVTYEYGNAFMISSGLFNALVLLDAHDVALGRK